MRSKTSPRMETSMLSMLFVKDRSLSSGTEKTYSFGQI